MNINEIAKMAGVSRATVSRYLNDGYVSEEKRDKIKKVIDKTGYHPSAQAQMLRNKKSKLIGVVIPKINSESISREVAGISEVLSKEGYQIILANSFNDEKEELKYLKTFKENNVDGVILLGTVFTKAHERAIKEIKVPIVVMGQETKLCSCIYFDDYEAARELTKKLLADVNNTEKVAYLGVTHNDKAVGGERGRGFFDVANEYGIKECNIINSEVKFSTESGYEEMEKILAKEKVSAVFCATDSIAIGAMMSIKKHGLSIPKDIKIVGFGDSTMGRVIDPKLTTVHYFYKTCGNESAKLLIELINKSESVKKQIKMGFEIIDSESV